MDPLKVVRIVFIAFFLIAGVLSTLFAGKVKKVEKTDVDYKKLKKKRRWLRICGVAFLWLGCGLIIGMFAEPSEGIHIQVMAPRMVFLGMDLSSSVVLTWIAMAGIILAAICIRIFVIPRFKEKPKGLQNLLEMAVEGISKYTEGRAPHLGDNLNAYMFSVAVLLIGCSVVELFGFRPPTADLMLTFSLALCTFVLINYYGIKRKGLKGRIKSLSDPTPVILPIRMLTDIAIPVSLACRLFGNMLGGMIVMELIYMALGAFGVGAPAVVGLYFNVFHPLIQAFIFVTLSLTFINEAAE